MINNILNRNIKKNLIFKKYSSLTNVKIEKYIENIKETKFNRGGLNGSGVVGLSPFFNNKIPNNFKNLYSEKELKELSKLKNTSRDIEKRMKVKISEHYLNLIKKNKNLENLVKARPEETIDLSGEIDPSNQNRYSPIPGLLHKYEMILLYTSNTCSSHCRYCYRFDLFTKKSGKEIANIDNIVDYITHFNNNKENNLNIINEVLLSGGDPMILPNKRIAKIIIKLAQIGITTIRIGTKELSFFPERFDTNFFKMLDNFHMLYPNVRIVFVTHFTHPAEFLELDENNNYISLNKNNNIFKWMNITRKAITELNNRHEYITLENQTPIIWKVNDNYKDLKLLQEELYHNGIGNHYFFQCRNIQGKKEFAIPIEEAWEIFKNSQKGLSGLKKSARFIMSTEFGKIEIIGDTLDKIIFKFIRIPNNFPNNKNIMIFKKNSNAY